MNKLVVHIGEDHELNNMIPGVKGRRAFNYPLDKGGVRFCLVQKEHHLSYRGLAAPSPTIRGSNKPSLRRLRGSKIK